jgi:MobA/MobL family
VAIYYLGMKTFGRARGKGGSRATSGAAYRAGERIRDERSGAVYDHRRRQDVVHKEIVLPARLAAAGPALDWARNRSALWNAAEIAERSANARVAREFTVALPHELTPERRRVLARRFAQEISDRYGSAVDLAIHAPRGDPRNFHAHLFTTTREITPQGLGPKTTLELSGTERHRRGLARWAEELTSIRGRWVMLANEALKEAHIEARITPPSRAEALHRVSEPRLPLAIYHMERRGVRSFVAERIRERHRAARAALQPGWAEQNDRSDHDTARSSARAGRVIMEQIRARVQEMGAALRGRFEEFRLSEKSARPIEGFERERTPVPIPDQRRTVPQHLQQTSLSQAAPRRQTREASTLRSDELASQSARKWAADRRAGRWGPETSLEEARQESARRWLAYREAALREGHDPSKSESASKGTESHQAGPGTGADRSRDTPARESAHGNDYDLGL